MADPLPLLISVNPDPLQAGQPGQICYDFQNESEEPTSVKLKVVWSVTGKGTQTETITITSDESCVNIDVPEGAWAVLIEDTSAASADYGGPVY